MEENRLYVGFEQKKQAELREAIARGEFEIKIIPRFNCQNGLISGGEIEVIWNHPTKKCILKEKYWELIEATGLVEEFDYFVWEEVCRIISKNQSKNSRVMPFLISLNETDLKNENLITLLDGLVEDYGIDKKNLEFGINESAFVNDDYSKQLFSLYRNGYSLIVGEIGSGKVVIDISKLEIVKGIKIAKSIIENYDTSHKLSIAIYSMIVVSKSLGIHVYGYKVKTKEQLQFLMRCGCMQVLGCFDSDSLSVKEYYSKTSDEELEKLLESQKRGILVIDDSRMVRMALMQALGNSFRYYQADNGQEGLDILNREAANIHLIVTDIFMPVMDGFEFISKSRKDPIRSEIPIIVVTSNGELEKEIQALMLGAVDVIQKPYDPVVVRQRVKNVLKMAEDEWIKMHIKLMYE